MTTVLNFVRKKFYSSVDSSRTCLEALPSSSLIKSDSAVTIRDITKFVRGERINEWRIESFIGEGSFGCVYKVNKDGKKNYALKFEYGFDKEDGDIVEVEKHVLSMGMKAGNKHMCELIDSGTAFTCSYIVMTLVGKTLQDLLRGTRRRKFTGGCALSVGRQCLEAIEELHRIGFIHRDIKPSNYAIGLNQHYAQRKIYLLDFGFSYQYVDSSDRLKIVKSKMSFKGTMRYASLASHYYHAPGRRDDLESWMYQQIEFTKILPWKHLQDAEDITYSKEQARSKEGMKKLLRGCPRYYLDIFKYIIDLKQDSHPDYDFLFKILRKTLFESHQPEYPYDWEMSRTSTCRPYRH